MESVAPDTVLILLGGNDIRQGSSVSTILTRLSLIIDRIREMNPDVVIHMAIYGYFIVDIPDSFLDSYAGFLKQLVDTKTTIKSPIHWVDHRSNWDKTIHIDQSDRYHPSDEGMQQMAVNWLASIKEHQAEEMVFE